MPDGKCHGQCLCGAIKWTYSGPTNWSGYCHCESCRRNCAAPVTAFVGIPNGSWSWTGESPAAYKHTTEATRYYCNKCGTPMAYSSTRYPDEIHFYAASMINPEQFEPNEHFHHGERLSWLTIADDLPRHLVSSIADEINKTSS